MAKKKNPTKKQNTEAAAAAAGSTPGSEEFLRVLEGLAERGRKNHGTLSRQELNEALASFELSDEQSDQASSYLEGKGIDILDMDNEDDSDTVSVYEEDDSSEEDEDAPSDELREIEAGEKNESSQDGTEYAGTEDSIRMYLREIGRIGLLNADEEIRLATRIENGQIAENLLAENILPVTEEALVHSLEDLELSEYREEKEEVFIGKSADELEELAADGRDAKNTLSESNLRLVVSIAKKYVGRGMSFLDLIQEGNLGLMKAVDKFDFRKGFKFSTYATWWIRQAITRAIADQARTIRIPVHMVETINKFIKITRNLTTELGREPTTAEIAERMGITEDKVTEIQQVAATPASLDSKIGDEEDSELGDFISDTTSVGPADAATFSGLRDQLREAMMSLTERERDVLTLRFGLSDGRPRTLEEVGRDFGVTRERIRQIEAKALRKLRHPSRAKKLKDYLEQEY